MAGCPVVLKSGENTSGLKMWRDHSPRSNELFKAGGYTDDLKYSADRFASGWLHTVTEAGAQEYSLPFFINYPTKAEYGEPGEDAATYLKFLPKVAFISQNLYSVSAREAELLKRMDSYRIGRNIVAISETNADRSPVAPRLAFLAIGGYAAPLFSPWAINMSTITESEPYVLKDGSLANGAFDLERTYTSIERAAPAIALCAGTDKRKVFLDGESRTAEVGGTKVTVNFDPGGQVMVLHPEPNEFVLVGWNTVCRSCRSVQYPGYSQRMPRLSVNLLLNWNVSPSERPLIVPVMYDGSSRISVPTPSKLMFGVNVWPASSDAPGSIVATPVPLAPFAKLRLPPLASIAPPLSVTELYTNASPARVPVAPIVIPPPPSPA